MACAPGGGETHLRLGKTWGSVRPSVDLAVTNWGGAGSGGVVLEVSWRKIMVCVCFVVGRIVWFSLERMVIVVEESALVLWLSLRRLLVSSSVMVEDLEMVWLRGWKGMWFVFD